MKKIIPALLISLLLQALSGAEIRISVVDSLGLPVEGVKVSLGFDNAPNIPRYFRRTGNTDKDGLYTTRASANISMSLVATKDGYYKFGYPNAQPLDFAMREIEGDFEYTVRMRKIRNPIPLMAKRSVFKNSSEAAYLLPKQNEWIGFDFMKFDWVEPYGRGEKSDIKFRYERQFHHIHIAQYTDETIESRREDIKGRNQRMGIPFNEEIFREVAGVWSGTLELRFVRPGDGWVKVEEDFVPESMLQMPHEAPVNGYKDAVWSRFIHSRNSIHELVNQTPKHGYFLRTRTELDAAGNVESAHYAKIVGEIGFYPTGKVWMTYYFNPTPNDRNLELDPKKNLIRSNNRYNPVQNLLP
ncbi:MAG: carboxypeptidase-like regulatory domain-containing protein [Opitutales bacterium]